MEEVVAFAGARYRSIRKRVEAVDVVPAGDRDVVYIKGTLEGVNLQGVRFEGVRFIDRFVVSGERILLQEVWNDLAEREALARGI